jgi:hypothetical protein
MQLGAARKQLTDQEQLILDSDPCTQLAWDDKPWKTKLEEELLAELAKSIRSAAAGTDLLEVIALTFRKYVQDGLDIVRARNLFLELCQGAEVSRRALLRVFERLSNGD